MEVSLPPEEGAEVVMKDGILGERKEDLSVNRLRPFEEAEFRVKICLLKGHFIMILEGSKGSPFCREGKRILRERDVFFEREDNPFDYFFVFRNVSDKNNDQLIKINRDPIATVIEPGEEEIVSNNPVV